MPRSLAPLAAALLLSGATCAAASCSKPAPPPLPDIATLPTFAFEDQDSQPLGTAQLHGRPWVANFLFTSCPTACPPLAQATADLQAKVEAWAPADADPPPVLLVSFTIDPITDTPERLRAYGERYKANPRLWRFARSTYDTTEQLVTEGFLQPLIRDDLMHVSDPTRRKAMLHEPIPLGTAHALRFVLVDGQGHIRGLYDRDPESVERLNADLRALAEATTP